MIDPVDLDNTLGVLQSRVAILDQRLDENTEALRSIAANLSQLLTTHFPVPTEVAAPAAAPTVSIGALRLPPPPRFDGTPEHCRGFLSQCLVHFELTPTAFASERARVGFIFSLLSDRALAWATPLWESGSPLTADSRTFCEALRQVFDVSARKESAAQAILTLRQGTQSFTDYSIRFRTIAAELEWNSEALTAAFLHGLSERLKDELATRDLPSTLDEVVNLVARLDARIRDRTASRTPRRPILLAPHFNPPSPPSLPVEDEPMQLGLTRSSEEERQRRRNGGLCFYCGERGHFVRSCSKRPGNGRT